MPHLPPLAMPNFNSLLMFVRPQTQLRCADDVSDDMCSVQCGRGLNLRSTVCPDRGAVGSSGVWENSHGRTGNRTNYFMTTKPLDWLYEAEVMSVIKHRLYI
jgi:hypothetical protein